MSKKLKSLREEKDRLIRNSVSLNQLSIGASLLVSEIMSKLYGDDVSSCVMRGILKEVDA
jgi:hypothetical protein